MTTSPAAPMFDFSGRHVFVAGGSSGINFGIAKGFARAGARIALISRSADKVATAVSQLEAEGAEAFGQAADVRQPEAVQAALEAAAARFGPIDVLVSGAAGNFLASVLDMSPNAFRTVVDIDLLGSFHVARLAHAHLRQPGACVIQISASQAFTPTPFQAHVCAAKAGVDMLTQVLAMEWGPQGIRVNSIVPGPIADTEGLRRLAPTDDTLAAMARRVPLSRLGQTQDIARMAMLLASDWGSYVTGAIIPVDGGLALTGPRDFSAAAAASRR
ncbi:NAD(P)-dependent dehydrogenase (short-subunit alcohol dehydrogenase family) [Pseudacidovorax intermedius]|uniref:NAD(P)-dependent dehydrogenase (Short-subunit alcohol dehydrogenase family) n=1 Tax=Pseudacidovorax intermedius TaxID=433924 RepID=A0A370FEZ3_9BURK|nr:SDR family oxidoreductase [Pseudacidovorax intermedius]RDI24162.1 NAD(P)-dependent dehydrogenase (short-subunit alcohol dehydrogenase family) [Pseudacidovorax intermedius]